MSSKNVCFQQKQLKTVEAYVLDSIHVQEKQLTSGEVQRIQTHFSVTALDVDMVKQYLTDLSNETRLNALKNWLNSSGMDYSYNKIKAILLIAFLS